MITAVMPAKGRIEQTLALIPRLKATAGLGDSEWRLVCVVDDDKELEAVFHRDYRPYIFNLERRGYWGSVSRALKQFPDSRYVVNLANDLLPGRDWLKNAALSYQRIFPNNGGVLGFNDGIHNGRHAAHFMADIAVLRRWYGDDYVPLCYDHMYGDTEINDRARQEGRLAFTPWAVLYHNHAYIGNELDDLYRLGHAQYRRDEQLYLYRRSHNWQSPSN